MSIYRILKILSIWAMLSPGLVYAESPRPPVHLSPTPDDGAADKALAQGYQAYQKGELTQALQWYRQAAAINPYDFSVQQDLGCLLAQTGDLEGAHQVLKRVTEQRPSASVYDALGQVQEQLGNLEGARVSFTSSVQLEPENAKTLWRLARVLLRLEHTAEAKKILTRVLTLDPTDAAAHYHMGELDLRAEQPELAIHEFRQVVETHPEHVLAWNGLAIAYLRIGSIEDAEKALGRAQALDAQNIHTRANTGVLAAARNRGNEARAIWEQILKEKPDFALATENLRRLENTRELQQP